jgi:HTH-type transcriptional regulator/antitoxin HipB
MGYIIQVPGQLSSHLRALRKAQNLSQTELGTRLGLSQARIARIEGDPLSVSVEQLLRVLAALGARLEIAPQMASDPSPEAGSATTQNSESADTEARPDPSRSEGDW